MRKPVFLSWLLIVFNYKFTACLNVLANGLLWCLMTFHAPQSVIDQGRLLTTRTWELKFLTPMHWLRAQYAYYHMHERVDVVVAHYREDLSWLAPYLQYIDHLYLYCKDASVCTYGLPENLQGAQLKITYLSNEGRETHSYLTHMIAHYDDMPRRTVFTLASMKDNWARQVSFVLALTESGTPFKHVVNPMSIEGIRSFHFASDTTVALSLGDGYRNARDNVIVTTPLQPLNYWMHERFKRDLLAAGYRCGEGVHGAIFSTDGQRVRRFSKDLYQTLLAENSGADSMETGYYMERVWRFMYAG
jgi:hypothetical protein